MLRSYSAAGRDFGLFVYEQSWLGIFTSGFDGRRVQLIGMRRPDGLFDIFKLDAPGESTSEWPPVGRPQQVKIGLCEILSLDDASMTLRYALDRYALGAPAVDFSPMPEAEITGTVLLGRVT